MKINRTMLLPLSVAAIILLASAMVDIFTDITLNGAYFIAGALTATFIIKARLAEGKEEG